MNHSVRVAFDRARGIDTSSMPDQRRPLSDSSAGTDVQVSDFEARHRRRDTRHRREFLRRLALDREGSYLSARRTILREPADPLL